MACSRGNPRTNMAAVMALSTLGSGILVCSTYAIDSRSMLSNSTVNVSEYSNSDPILASSEIYDTITYSKT